MATRTLTRPPRGHARRRTVGRDTRLQARSAWLLLTPFLVMYLLFLIVPTLYGLLMSFFNTSLYSGGLGAFQAVANYADVLTERMFWSSMWHTVYFTILTTPPLVIIALGLAVLADRVTKGRWFFRLVFFAPYVVPVSVATMIWGWLYAPQLGLLDSWLTQLGLPAPTFLGSPNWAMISVAIMTVWWTLGFNFVLYLAGLQDIPAELYEAAAVDGATAFQQIRSITIPLLSRTTVLVTVLQLLASLKIFDQIYIMTGGGPNYSTRPVLEYIYDVGFTDGRVGYTAAASMVYFVGILLVSLGWFLIVRRQQKAG